MQPILSSGTAGSFLRAANCRDAVVNYADPGRRHVCCKRVLFPALSLPRCPHSPRVLFHASSPLSFPLPRYPLSPSSPLPPVPSPPLFPLPRPLSHVLSTICLSLPCRPLSRVPPILLSPRVPSPSSPSHHIRFPSSTPRVPLAHTSQLPTSLPASRFLRRPRQPLPRCPLPCRPRHRLSHVLSSFPLPRVLSGVILSPVPPLPTSSPDCLSRRLSPVAPSPTLPARPRVLSPASSHAFLSPIILSPLSPLPRCLPRPLSPLFRRLSPIALSRVRASLRPSPPSSFLPASPSPVVSFSSPPLPLAHSRVPLAHASQLPTSLPASPSPTATPLPLSPPLLSPHPVVSLSAARLLSAFSPASPFLPLPRVSIPPSPPRLPFLHRPPPNVPSSPLSLTHAYPPHSAVVPLPRVSSPLRVLSPIVHPPLHPLSLLSALPLSPSPMCPRVCSHASSPPRPSPPHPTCPLSPIIHSPHVPSPLSSPPRSVSPVSSPLPCPLVPLSPFPPHSLTSTVIVSYALYRCMFWYQ